MLGATGEVTPNIDYASQDVTKPEETAFPSTFRRVCTNLRLPIIGKVHHNRTEPAAQAHMQASSLMDHVQCGTRGNQERGRPKSGCEIWICLARIIVARLATK
jgi:hypothetical protein